MVSFLKAIGSALTVMFTDHSHEIERETNNPASAVVDAGDAEQAPPAYLALSLFLSQLISVKQEY
jgi:hypothetical protein